MLTLCVYGVLKTLDSKNVSRHFPYNVLVKMNRVFNYDGSEVHNLNDNVEKAMSMIERKLPCVDLNDRTVVPQPAVVFFKVTIFQI